MRGGLAFFFNLAGLAVALGLDGFGALGVPQAFGAQIRIDRIVAVLDILFRFGEVFVDPAPGVRTFRHTKRAMYFPIILGHEAFNLFFALDQDRQRWRLHAAHRRFVKTAALGVERGHGARAVDAHQPVGLRTTDRGVGQRQHFFVGAKVLEAVLDRTGSHRLQPQALYRLFTAGVTGDVTEDQLAFAARVAGVNHAGDVFAFQELGQQLQARFGFLDRQQIKMRRNHRQISERPLPALDFELFGHGDLHQMADGGRQHKVVTFKIVVVLFKAAEHARDIAGHRGLLRDNELFRHGFFWTLARKMLCSPQG